VRCASRPNASGPKPRPFFVIARAKPEASQKQRPCTILWIVTADDAAIRKTLCGRRRSASPCCFSGKQRCAVDLELLQSKAGKRPACKPAARRSSRCVPLRPPPQQKARSSTALQQAPPAQESAS